MSQIYRLTQKSHIVHHRSMMEGSVSELNSWVEAMEPAARKRIHWFAGRFNLGYHKARRILNGESRPDLVLAHSIQTESAGAVTLADLIKASAAE